MGYSWPQWCDLVLVSHSTHHRAVPDRVPLLVPTRLMALKHGASLVWSPEVVDKAILHAERVVDRKSLAKFHPLP